MIFDQGASCCEQKQKIVVSRENRNEHILYNDSNCDVYQFHIDGGIVQGREGKRCDFVVEAQNENFHKAYVIELKGSDLDHAIEQILQTIQDYKGKLAGGQIFPRIILHKVVTHDIHGKRYRDLKKTYPETVIACKRYEDRV